MSSSNFAAQEEMIEVNQWAGSDVHFAQVNYESQNGGSIKSFLAVISNDHDGKHILELRVYNSNAELCGLPYTNGRAVMKINGQSVTMNMDCVSEFDSDSLRYHAETDEGRTYIVDSFLSNEYVPVGMQEYEVKSPTAGFKAAWIDYPD